MATAADDTADRVQDREDFFGKQTFLSGPHLHQLGLHLKKIRNDAAESVKEWQKRHAIIQIGSHPVRFERRTDYGSIVSGIKEPGSLSILPVGPVPYMRLYTPSDMISCNLEQNFVQGIADEMDRRPSAVPRFQSGILDEPLGKILDLLQAELSAGAPSGNLYLETLAHALAIQFLLLDHPDKKNQVSSVKAMPPAKLSRIKDRIEAELDKELSLTELAMESGYSRAHFLRMFRAATGLTPHQYILDRRLHRAQGLLKYSRTELTDIAAACGFSGQTHMNDIFRKKLKTTPGKYRSNR
jgi:AraC family transcriptional regulator